MTTALDKNRVGWIDYSKGICIIAVACLYTTQHIQGTPGTSSWMQYWVDFARPFRMPDFFLIAGLFLSRTIDAPWRRYLDKKVVHFFYFFALWTTIYFAFHIVQGHVTSPYDGLRQYGSWYVEPFHMLWFIEMLPIYFLVTRLLKPVPWFLVLPMAAILQIANINMADEHYAQVGRFCARYVYLYAGYMFAPQIFGFAGWVERHGKNGIEMLLVWALANEALVLAGVSQMPIVGLVLGFVGAGAVIVSGCLLSRLSWTGWLKYLGQNSIVVFLAFFVFTMLTDSILNRIHMIGDLGTRQLVATIVAVCGPVLLFRFVRHTPARFLFNRPQWAHLGPAVAWSEATLGNVARTTEAAVPVSTPTPG